MPPLDLSNLPINPYQPRWVQIQLNGRDLMVNLDNVENVVAYTSYDDIVVAIYYVSGRHEEYKHDHATAVWAALKPFFS